MDIITSGFLILIVVVSGLIAVLADNLGKKVGKKRLTFYRIRPRHIANIAVAASGIIVSLFTILIVAALSQDVRTWITDGRHAIEEVARIRVEGKRLEENNSQLRTTNGDLEKIVRQRTETANRLQKQLDKQAEQIDKGKAQVLKLTDAVNQGSAKIKSLNDQYSQSKADLARRKVELESAKTQLATIKSQILQVREDRKTAIKEYNDINIRNLGLETQNAKLEANIGTLKGRVAKLEMATKDLETKRQQVADELTASTASLGAAKAELETLNAELTVTRNNYAEAQRFNVLVGSTFTKVRQEPLTFRLGEEVSRMAIPALLTSDEATRAVQTFLSMARTSAINRGARGNASYGAADIMDRIGGDGTAQIPSNVLKRALVERVMNSAQPLVLVGNSSLNAFAGEPVSLEVSVFPNLTKYQPGQILAETSINTDRSTADILRQVSEFVSGKVSERLAKDGMIGKMGSDSPFGTVNSTDLLNLVDQLREEKRRVNLRVTVAAETHAADPVKLVFQLK